MSSLPSGFIKIGPYPFGENTKALCTPVLKFKGGGKVDKKTGDGNDGATTTWKGKEAPDLDIEITWDSADKDADAAIEEQLYQLSPYGPNAGKAWGLSARRQRLYGLDEIMIEKMSGPDDVPDTTKVTVKLSCTSSAKQKDGKAKTPGAADKSPDKQWVDSNVGRVDHFGGNDNEITFTRESPTVTP